MYFTLENWLVVVTVSYIIYFHQAKLVPFYYLLVHTQAYLCLRTKIGCRAGTTHCQLGKARGNCMEGFGERSAWFRNGHSIRCTDPIAIYLGRATDSQVSRNSMLTTTRILVSELATARVFCYPPTTPNSLMAPSLPSRDLSALTIPSDKGSGTSPPPPTVDILKKVD